MQEGRSNINRVREMLNRKAKELPGKILKILEIEAVRSIRMNFTKQGRPERWKAKMISDGRKILSGKSGDLFSSISSSLQGERVTIKFGTNYAEIHNKGGRIEVTKKMRKYFWAKYYETKKPVWKNMALNKKGYIEIPQREFAKLTREDIERIVKIIKLKV